MAGTNGAKVAINFLFANIVYKNIAAMFSISLYSNRLCQRPNRRQSMILRAVSSNCIQQQIHDVYLKHRKFIPVHRHHKLNLRTGPIRHRRREVIPLPSRMMPNPRLLSIGLGYVTHYIGWHCESLKSVTITAISWGIGLFIHFIFFLFEQKKTIKGYARMRYSVI